MKKLLFFLLVVTLMFVGLSARFTSPVNAAPDKVEVVMGGGTAVLFSNGDIYDLTMNGWQKTVQLPKDVSVANVKVVLANNRIVMTDGTGWIYAGGKWTKMPSPIR